MRRSERVVIASIVEKMVEHKLRLLDFVVWRITHMEDNQIAEKDLEKLQEKLFDIIID